MKGIPSTAGRGLAGLLFAAMLVVGTLKAQGCQRPADEVPDEMKAVTETPDPNPVKVPEPTTAAQEEGAPAEPASEAPDAGLDAPDVAPLEPRHMMPATKSGMPIQVPNNAPQQQQKAD